MNYRDLDLPQQIVGWIVNNAQQRYWQVAAWIDLEDLVHDGLVAAYKCRERYGSRLDGPHFMRLVQRTFNNQINDLLRQSLGFDDSIKLMDLRASSDGERLRTESDILDRIAEPTDALQEFAMLIAELPVHLRNAVELLINDPRQFRQALRIKFSGGTQDTLSKRLARKIGWPEHLDFETELRSYIWKRQRGLLTWESSAIKARLDAVKASSE